MGSQEVVCNNPNCRAQLGWMVTVEGVELLQIGGVLVRQAHGVCIKCGKEFHWSVSERMLERLIGLVKAEAKDE